MPATAITAKNVPARQSPTRTSKAPLSRKLPSPPGAANREGISSHGSQPVHKSQPVQNRVRVLLVHIPRLSIRGQARLAAEVGVSRSTISL